MLPIRMLGPLMLLSVLPDSSAENSACPLTLDPPELVQKLGQLIVVNCTTPVDGHRGITWKYDKNKTKFEDVETFNELKVAIEWDLQAQCSLEFNDSYVCSKDLPITVYKIPSSITVISNSPALEKTIHELQCEIDGVAPVQNLTVTWYKNNQTMKTEHFNLTASTPTHVSSALEWRVIREDDGALITCEVLLDLGKHEDPLVSNNILSVLYAPKFQDEVELIFLNKSGDVSLHCEAQGNPPPLYNWTKDEVTIAVNTQNLNVSHIIENITYNCLSSNHMGNVWKKFNIIVMETTDAANEIGCPLTITPDELFVKYGDSSLANCSTSLKDARGIGWEATIGGISLKKVTHLQWRVDKVEVWTISAGCFINLNNGSQCEKPINVTIYKTPDRVRVSPIGSDEMVEGRPQQLKCEIFNVAPVGKLQVTWYRGHVLLHTEMFNVSEVRQKNVSSILTVTPEKVHNGANFTCEAHLLLGQKGPNAKVISAAYTAAVQYIPTIKSCPTEVAGKENEFTLDTVPCVADGNPKPDIHWYHKDILINASKPLTRRESGKYTAQVDNIIGSRHTTVDITIEYGPSFSCKDQYDINENDHLSSECEPGGVPKPDSVWFRDGRLIVFGQPHLWRRQESGKYSIEATNKHGQANHSLSINVLYLPTFTKGNFSKEFSPGENVTLDCSAEGNPLPELQWKYPPAANVKNDTRGRQININITGATFSNVGVYSCGATNKVGTVSRTVTLTMKEKTNNRLVLLVVLSIFFLVLIIVGVVCYRNYKRKQGHYTVVGLSDSIPLRSSAVSVM